MGYIYYICSESPKVPKVRERYTGKSGRRGTRKGMLGYSRK